MTWASFTHTPEKLIIMAPSAVLNRALSDGRALSTCMMPILSYCKKKYYKIIRNLPIDRFHMPC